MANLFPIPLNAIRAIEIVARRGALAPAAEELGVTPGAVSQHLRRAEARLGLELFERTPQGLKPTPALQLILPRLSNGFATLAEALGSLRAADERTLTVTTGNVFASRWLVWRLSKFAALEPDIEVRLVVTGRSLDLRHTDIDCGIRFGRGIWDGLHAELLGGQAYRPVAAPALADRVRQPADLAKIPVIRDTTTMLSWDLWYRRLGFATPPAITGPTYDDPALAFDAAISGLGALMAVDLMSADAASDGRLRRLFEPVLEERLGYWFVVRDGVREPRKTRLFRAWLKAEIPASLQGYAAQQSGASL